jgi:hypothetical protein
VEERDFVLEKSQSDSGIRILLYFLNNGDMPYLLPDNTSWSTRNK